MRNTGVLLVFSLALCNFLGVNSNDENDENKIPCDKYMIFQEFIACPHVYSDVCGTNGQTYNHECKICEQNLASGQNIGMKYKGQCAEEKYCGIRVHPTPVCTRENNPHCGSNGKTYNNKCEFCSAVWENKEPLTLKHLGQCGSAY